MIECFLPYHGRSLPAFAVLSFSRTEITPDVGQQELCSWPEAGQSTTPSMAVAGHVQSSRSFQQVRKSSETVICGTMESLTSVGWQHVDVVICGAKCRPAMASAIQPRWSTSSKCLTFAAVQQEHPPTRVFGRTPPNNHNNSHSVHLRSPGAARPQTGLGQLAPASPSRHNTTPVAAESSQLLRLAAIHRHPHAA